MLSRWAQARHIIMTRSIVLAVFMIICFLTSLIGQKANLIIQVNEKLIVTSLCNFHIVLDSIDSRKQFPVNYIPGDLSIDENVWSKISQDSTTLVFLKFDYITFDRKGQEVSKFYVQLTSQKLKHPYLILNIYDFRDKKYRRWYQWHTNNNFLAELIFPGSGIYIRNS